MDEEFEAALDPSALKSGGLVSLKSHKSPASGGDAGTAMYKKSEKGKHGGKQRDGGGGDRKHKHGSERGGRPDKKARH